MDSTEWLKLILDQVRYASFWLSLDFQLQHTSRNIFMFKQIPAFESVLYTTLSKVPNSATRFRHIGKILKALGNFERVYLVFGKMSTLLWQLNYTIRQFLLL